MTQTAAQQQASNTQQQGSDAQQQGSTDKGVLRRLLGCLLHYRIRLTLGFFLALIVSLSNLLLLSGMVPILNIISAPEEVKIFTLDAEEQKLLKIMRKIKAYLSGKGCKKI